jgi:SAM-dependent methyltransferase
MTVHSGHRVNYDTIAHLYDEPIRDHPVDANLNQFLGERPDLQREKLRILDMGCGTGKQQSANKQDFPNSLVIGMDLFRNMLKQARKRGPDVIWMQGNSVNPPFKAGSFDYITNQFSYHHVFGKRDMVPEIFRMLKPGGRFVMTNIDPWSMPNWIVYRFFPTSMQRDFADFWQVDEFAAILENAGFSNVQFSHELLPTKENLGSFLEYATQRVRTSQLIAISDADWELGLANLSAEVARSGANTQIDSEVCLVTLSGDKAADRG